MAFDYMITIDGNNISDKSRNIIHKFLVLFWDIVKLTWYLISSNRTIWTYVFLKRVFKEESSIYVKCCEYWAYGHPSNWYKENSNRYFEYNAYGVVS